ACALLLSRPCRSAGPRYPDAGRWCGSVRIICVAILPRRGIQQIGEGSPVATLEQCRTALSNLVTRLAANAEAGGRLDFDRTLACRITDLGAAFHGRLAGGRIE